VLGAVGIRHDGGDVSSEGCPGMGGCSVLSWQTRRARVGRRSPLIFNLSVI